MATKRKAPLAGRANVQGGTMDKDSKYLYSIAIVLSIIVVIIKYLTL